MERLTERYIPNDEKKGIAGIKVFESENKTPLVKVLSGEYLYPAIEKLADYEELEERLHKIFGEESTFSLADVIDTLEMELSEPDKKHPVNARILTYEEANKWQEYKDLEEQGMLVRLPCKVGDMVWDNDFGYLEPYEIKAFSYGYCDSYVEPGIGIEDEIIFYYENYTRSITGAFPMSEIGKTVFLTREEAEKALEELQNDK